MPTAFISYSWESDQHKAWVRDFAARLRADGIDVRLDQWDLVPGDQLPEFMERAVRESDFVLVVCTPRYREKSDQRVGGVGYEGDIMSGEVFTDRNQRKFIPILREPPWPSSAPTWLLSKYYVDLSQSPFSESQYQDLLNTILGTRPLAPPIGNVSPPDRRQTKPIPRSTDRTQPEQFDPIKVSGVILDQIGTPRRDGTPGSALYRVPFRLSRRPTEQWTKFFVDSWDYPPRFTTMHRPGIAAVAGDTVILDGTTVEEVQNYHRDTLILAAEEANRKYSEYNNRVKVEEEREAKRIANHKRDVEEQAKRIKFDD